MTVARSSTRPTRWSSRSAAATRVPAEVKRGQELVSQLQQRSPVASPVHRQGDRRQPGRGDAANSPPPERALGKAQVKLDANSQVTIANTDAIAGVVTNPGTSAAVDCRDPSTDRVTHHAHRPVYQAQRPRCSARRRWQSWRDVEFVRSHLVAPLTSNTPSTPTRPGRGLRREHRAQPMTLTFTAILRRGVVGEGGRNAFFQTTSAFQAACADRTAGQLVHLILGTPRSSASRSSRTPTRCVVTVLTWRCPSSRPPTARTSWPRYSGRSPRSGHLRRRPVL